VAIWLWRASRPVPPHLEGLDLITKRRWLRSDTNRREHLLDSIREVRGPAPVVSLAREPEAIAPGPAMPISLDAASTSLGVASSPGVPFVSAASASSEEADAWLSPSLADAVPLGWIDQPVPPSVADAQPHGWLDDPAPATQPLTSAGLVPPPVGPPATDKGYGDPHE
jgi:predicted component of type VI protein secretion system